MSVRKTLQVGDPLLKAKNRRVTNFSDPKIRQIIQDLTDSMHHENLIGMAAPQIGENYQIFVTQPRETEFRPKDQADILRVFINPKIIERSRKQVVIYEGCGSVSNAQSFGPVRRPQKITVEAYDASGKKFQFSADGILGRVIQHEYDHLIGREFLSEISDYQKMVTFEQYVDQIRSSAAQKKASKITVKKLL